MHALITELRRLLDVFGRPVTFTKSSSYGDCLPSRDFPMLVDLHLQGRLPLEKFVSETIGLDDVDANRFVGAIPTMCPQFSSPGMIASVMILAAVGSLSPSRSSRRHVQKSRASRTSTRVCPAGRPAAGSAVASWRAS